MDFKIEKDVNGNITISGDITEHELIRIYCECSNNNRHKLDMMRDLAKRSGRMSDHLMYISELVRVNEEFNRPVEDLEDLQSLQALLE